MRISGKPLLSASVVLLSVGLWGQQLYQPKVLARLSYDSSAMSQGEGVRHVCVAVSADGWYRIVRTVDHGENVRAQGTTSGGAVSAIKEVAGLQRISKAAAELRRTNSARGRDLCC